MWWGEDTQCDKETLLSLLDSLKREPRFIPVSSGLSKPAGWRETSIAIAGGKISAYVGLGMWLPEFAMRRLLDFPERLWTDPEVGSRMQEVIRHFRAIDVPPRDDRHPSLAVEREVKVRMAEFLAATHPLNFEQQRFLKEQMLVHFLYNGGPYPGVTLVDYLLTLCRRKLVRWEQITPDVQHWSKSTAFMVLRMTAICDPKIIPAEKLVAWTVPSVEHFDWLRYNAKRREFAAQLPSNLSRIERIKQLRASGLKDTPSPGFSGYSVAPIRWLAHVVLVLQKNKTFDDPEWQSVFTLARNMPSRLFKEGLPPRPPRSMLDELNLISRHTTPELAAAYVRNALDAGDVRCCDILIPTVAESRQANDLLRALADSDVSKVAKAAEAWLRTLARKHSNGRGSTNEPN